MYAQGVRIFPKLINAHVGFLGTVYRGHYADFGTGKKIALRKIRVSCSQESTNAKIPHLRINKPKPRMWGPC